MQNTARSDSNASAKEKVSGQTFRLSIWNGILEHCSKIKDAIWLLLLFVDWTTEEEAGAGRSADRGGTGGLEGIVRGGIVVSDGITAKEFPGITGKTTRRWRERLASHGFIRENRKNYGYAIRVLKSKKWDADGARGTFRIPVSTGILDHYKKLKSSVWLLFWYIDKTTVEENGHGHVLGGKPVLDSVPARVLGVSNDTIAAWRENLERHGYIRARRTPYGHAISVAKSKKWVGKKRSQNSQNSESQNSQNPVSLKNSTSENSRSSGSEFPIPRVRIPKNQGENSQKPGNKEDIAVDFAVQDRDVAEEAAAAPAPANPKPERQNPANPNPKGKSKKVSKEAWEAFGERPFGPRWFVLGWEKAYQERPEGELLKDTMEEFIQLCQRQEPKRMPPDPFYKAKRRVEQQEADDDSEVARVATYEYRQAEAERIVAEMEARQESEREAETARFDALSQEEKLAELKAKLASMEEMIAGFVKRGASSGVVMQELQNQKAKLERQIAELSSPICPGEISLTAPEKLQLLSQFPEAWDAVDVAETKELEVAA